MIRKLIRDNSKLVIGLIVGILISAFTSYAVAATVVINSNAVEYKDNSGLGVTNVQAAIDGTCTKFSNQLTNLKKEVINEMYPKGSIYITTELTTTSQVTQKLGGTWEVYGQGRTLVGNDGKDYIPNNSSKGSGGATSVSTTLKTENLPNHTHTYSKSSTVTASHTLTIDEMPSHNHKVQYAFAGSSGSGNVTTIDGYPITKKNGEYELGTVSSVGGNAGHTHSITLTTTNTSSVGSGTAFTTSTMQPYIVVYMYRRTA